MVDIQENGGTSTLKMEAAGSSETVVALYQAARYHNPKDITHNIHRLQNFRYYITEIYFSFVLSMFT
jgi:hypothetical protein